MKASRGPAPPAEVTMWPTPATRTATRSVLTVPRRNRTVKMFDYLTLGTSMRIR